MGNREPRAHALAVRRCSSVVIASRSAARFQSGGQPPEVSISRTVWGPSGVACVIRPAWHSLALNRCFCQLERFLLGALSNANVARRRHRIFSKAVGAGTGADGSRHFRAQVLVVLGKGVDGLTGLAAIKTVHVASPGGIVQCDCERTFIAEELRVVLAFNACAPTLIATLRSFRTLD